jgi:N-acetylmuramoyl-L-alanine amidase
MMNEELRALRKRCAAFPLFFGASCLIILSASLNIVLAAETITADAAETRAILQTVSHVSTTDYTRITLSLSEEVRHKIFSAPADPRTNAPARLVIDFTPARRGPRVPLTVAIHDGLLQQVRTGQFSSSTVRVVLDIESIDNYKTFVLYNPYRLIIDVRGRAKREAPRAPAPAKPESLVTIMLDPGHGGKDPGAMGAARIPEKDIVLAISRRLGRKLSTRLPIKVLYTRLSDVFVPLEERIAQANAARVDLFISIHANASVNTDLQGVETYYLNNTNDRATIRLAALENGLRLHGGSRSDGEAGLSYLLSDLIQSGKEEDSIALAHHLQDALITRARERYPAVRDLGVKKGPFYVLVGAHMPCVLVETAFMTHRVEGKYLMEPAYQEALAEGLFLGVARFLRTARMEKSL